MHDLEYYLNQGDIDKIQKAYINTTVEDRKKTNKFALLTSKSYVITLDANPDRLCNNPTSSCFVSSINQLKPCYGIPIKVILRSLNNINVQDTTPGTIEQYVCSLERLREAEFAKSRAEMILSYEPSSEEWNKLFNLSKRTVQHIRKSEQLDLSNCVSKHNPLELMKLMHHHGIIAVHILLVGLGDCSVDELRSIKGITVAFPTWIVLKSNLKTECDVLKIINFIKERHDSYDEFEDCIPSATYHDYRVDELKLMQNIPAWEWARISLIHTWIRKNHPNTEETYELCKNVGLSNKYANILKKIIE
mgnify:CR=1 FL=1